MDGTKNLPFQKCQIKLKSKSSLTAFTPSLSKSSLTAFTPSGPKALLLRSNSTKCAPTLYSPFPYTQSIVVKPQFLYGVARLTLQEFPYSFHAIRTKGVITQVQLN